MFRSTSYRRITKILNRELHIKSNTLQDLENEYDTISQTIELPFDNLHYVANFFSFLLISFESIGYSPRCLRITLILFY